MSGCADRWVGNNHLAPAGRQPGADQASRHTGAHDTPRSLCALDGDGDLARDCPARDYSPAARAVSAGRDEGSWPVAPVGRRRSSRVGRLTLAQKCHRTVNTWETSHRRPRFGRLGRSPAPSWGTSRSTFLGPRLGCSTGESVRNLTLWPCVASDPDTRRTDRRYSRRGQRPTRLVDGDFAAGCRALESNAGAREEVSTPPVRATATDPWLAGPVV